MTKAELKQACSEILDLIEQTNLGNVYNNIVPFFQATAELYDRRDEIDSLPLKQKSPSIWMRLFSKEQARKIDEEIGELWRQKLKLTQTIKNCGRNMAWNNRTKKGEPVTKENIYFGGIQNLGELSVAKWEEYKTSCPRTYEIIAHQMVDFMQHKKDGFGLINWF